MKAPTFKTYAEEVAYKRGFVDGDLFAEKRIIKLLEFPNGWHETVYVAGEGEEHFADSCATCINIALIKGENK